MGFFRKASAGRDHRRGQTQRIAQNERPAWMRNGMAVTLVEGHEDLEVVGESFYQENLWRLVGGRRAPEVHIRCDIYALLVAEDDNPYDSNAIAVWAQGWKVGYLSREDARRYRPGLLALQDRYGTPIALAGVIVGGGIRAVGPGKLGVFLRHDPEEFGFRRSPPPPRAESRMRTGLSAAAAAQSDGSYDMSWLRDLPVDDIRAIPALRKKLAHEEDPLNRHFMYAQLEILLYRSREVFASALDEYDRVCHQHDAEMNAIRAAFMAEWGQVPLLEVYRQMTIRQQKAHNFDQALWWAERGIAVYGDDCARPEDVEDLRHRAAACKAKIATRAQVR
jgi:hypothetical protein